MLNDLKNYIINARGIKTNRKIIVFLVDDYGTIRISSKNAFQKLQETAPTITKNRFNQFDDIASADDLTALYEVLTSVKDKNGHPAVFTPMTVVANPNFKAIREAEYGKYYYESFFDTIEKRHDGTEIKDLWREGISHGIFMPEFHGREHLNERLWLEFLQKKDLNVSKAFDYESIGIEPTIPTPKGYMAAFDFINKEHLDELNTIITDGLEVFEKLFDYKSTFFTAPALVHNDEMHQNLHENGVQFIDVARNRKEPLADGTYKRKFHYIGQRNRLGQRYITRNVMFEPNKSNEDWVDKALKDIEVAFKFKKPAIISSHRVNFVSGKSMLNRDSGLKSLKVLLSQIIKKWPESEFLAVKDLIERCEMSMNK